jgi:phage-related protein
MYLFRYTQTITKNTPTLTVSFYRTEAGNEPVRDWLIELPRDDRKAVGTDIKTVQFGWPIGMPVVRKMETGLWEVRTDLTDTIARVLFTVEGSTLLLLHGFIKKSQKTPAADLATARMRKATLKRHQQ